MSNISRSTKGKFQTLSKLLLVSKMSMVRENPTSYELLS